MVGTIRTALAPERDKAGGSAKEYGETELTPIGQFTGLCYLLILVDGAATDAYGPYHLTIARERKRRPLSLAGIYYEAFLTVSSYHVGNVNHT